eukprot:m.92803 g.92803  ORF g.92803 m.92803 type:complete len:85 (+) comp16523_c0_seq1:1065-1319(+)
MFVGVLDCGTVLQVDLDRFWQLQLFASLILPTYPPEWGINMTVTSTAPTKAPLSGLRQRPVFRAKYAQVLFVEPSFVHKPEVQR